MDPALKSLTQKFKLLMHERTQRYNRHKCYK